MKQQVGCYTLPYLKRMAHEEEMWSSRPNLSYWLDNSINDMAVQHALSCMHPKHDASQARRLVKERPSATQTNQCQAISSKPASRTTVAGDTERFAWLDGHATSMHAWCHMTDILKLTASAVPVLSTWQLPSFHISWADSAYIPVVCACQQADPCHRLPVQSMHIQGIVSCYLNPLKPARALVLAPGQTTPGYAVHVYGQCAVHP